MSETEPAATAEDAGRATSEQIVDSNEPRPQWMSRPCWSQAKNAALGAG